MAVEALVTPFLHVELFQGLPPLHLAKLAHLAERIVFRPGDLIIREGAAGDAAYLVVAGDTSRIDGPFELEGEEALPVHTLIGEMAMLIDTEHTSTVIAKSQVRALRLPREAMYELMQEVPSLAEHLIDKLTGRLQQIAIDLRQIDETFATSAVSLPGSRTMTAAQGEAPSLH